MGINTYTRDLIQQRQVARLDNPQAVENAGMGARAFGMASDYVYAEYQQQQKIKLNDSVISYKKDMADLADTMRSENMATPEEFATRFSEQSKELAKRYQEGLDSREAKQAFDLTQKEIDLSAYQSNLSCQRERSVQNMATALEDSQQKLEALAYRGGDVDKLINDMKASSIAAQGLLSPEQVDNYLDKGTASIVGSKIDSLLNSGQTSAAKALLDSGKYDSILGGDGLASGYNAIETKRKQQNAEFKAAETNKLSDEYGAFTQAYQLGVIPPESQVQEMRSRAVSLGKSSVVEDIDMRLKTHGAVNSFVKNTDIAGQQSVLAEKMESVRNNPTKENIFEYKSLAQAYDNKIKHIQAGNGMAYYEDIGLIPRQEPIDVTQPDSVIDSFAQRRVAQRAIQQREGVTVPLFTKQEAQGMAQHYKDLPIKDKRNYILSMTANLNKEEASQLASVVAEDQPSLAGILALSKENPKLAEEAIKGSMLENKISSKGDVYGRMVQSIGSAVDDPRALNSSMDVIRDAYEQRLIKSGKQVDDFGLLDEVIEEAFGEVISFGNSNVLPFRKEDGQFVDTLEFQQNINDINVNLLENKNKNIPFIGGRPITDNELKEAIFNWEMVTVGDGVYQIRNGNDILVGENGAPYIFDMKNLTSEMTTESLFSQGFKMLSGYASKSIQPLAEE